MVGACTSIHRHVQPCSAIEAVVATQSDQEVVAAQAAQGIGCGRASQHIRAARSGKAVWLSVGDSALDSRKQCGLVLGRLREADQHPLARDAVSQLVNPVVVPALIGCAVQHVAIQQCDQGTVGRIGSVQALEFGAVDEAGCHLRQADSVIHLVNPVTQTALIGRAGEGGLVQPVGLASVAVEVKGQIQVGKL